MSVTLSSNLSLTGTSGGILYEITFWYHQANILLVASTRKGLSGISLIPIQQASLHGLGNLVHPNVLSSVVFLNPGVHPFNLSLTVFAALDIRPLAKVVAGVLWGLNKSDR